MVDRVVEAVAGAGVAVIDSITPSPSWIRWCRPTLVILLLLSSGRPLLAQQQVALQVSVKPAPPFVSVDPGSGQVSGFSVDLMREIATKLKRDVEFLTHDTVSSHLDAVRNREVDLSISATSISADRERELDFSQPFYQSGLDIAVRHEDINIWAALWSSQLRTTLIWLLAFVVLCAHLIWISERRKGDGFDDRWLPGVGQGLWWTIVTMSTVGYGDFVPRNAFSRVLGVVIIFVGIILFGVSVGVFSSSFTVQQLSSSIQSPDDLRGQKVCVVQGTVAEDEARRRGAFTHGVASLPEAFATVAAGDAIAVVHDLPQLKHYISQSDGDFALVGRPFLKHAYGIAFPLGSGLRKEVNVALLELMEDEPSTYDRISARWFGAD
ncbi:MAG: transporter substrate-binding domain-containing protein [Rubripirellula sp.]